MLYEVMPVADWKTLPKANIENIQWVPVEGIRAFGQLAYDENFLYVRMEAVEEHILRRYTGDNDPVCTDSCLEFFFTPQKEGDRYFNVEVNPNGACYFGFGKLRHQRFRILCKKVRELLNISTFETEQGWGVEYAIPVWFIQMFCPEFKLQPGLQLRCNFYKCAEDSVTPHFMTWSKVDQETPDFHQPKFFGDLIFK